MKIYLRLVGIFILVFFLQFFFPYNTASAYTIFSDNFDSGNADQWTPLTGHSSWKVENGRYGAKVENSDTIIHSIAGSISIPNYIFEFDMFPILGDDKNIVFRWRNDIGTYGIHFNSNTGGLNQFGKTTPIQDGWPLTTTYGLLNGEKYHFRIVLNGQHIQVFVTHNGNETKIFDGIDFGYTFSGNENVALRVTTGGSFPTEIYFDNILISSLSDNSNLTVPLLKQTSEPWQSEIYDSANLWNPSQPTINRWGCAMTSAAMILQYYGYTKLPAGINLDPGSLNSWLKSQPDGYVGSGWINWLAISRLSKQARVINNISTFEALEYSRTQGENKFQLTDDLNNQRPDILEVPGHFIVAKGIDGDTFNINDPFYDRNTLTDGYENTFLSLGRYVPSNTDLSYIMVMVNNEIELKFHDENGNIVGDAFIQQPILNPLNSHPSGPSMKIVYLPKPINKSYRIVLSTDANMPFSLSTLLYDVDGEVKVTNFQGIVTTNTDESFSIYFDKTNKNNTIISRNTTYQSTRDDVTNGFIDSSFINDNFAKNLIRTLNQAEENSLIGDIKGEKNKLGHFEDMILRNRGKNISEILYQTLQSDVDFLQSTI